MRKNLSILLCFCLLFQLQARSPYYKNLTINEGLISNRIYNIIEDRNGFIWVCTDQGVSRYDGVEFVNFTVREGMPDNEVLGLYEDQTGRIWFNSFSSEPCYYFEGKIYNSTNDPFLKRIKLFKPEGMCYSFVVSHNNSMAFLIESTDCKLIIGKDIKDIKVLDKQYMRANQFQNILNIKGNEYRVVSKLELIYWTEGDSVKLDPYKIWGISLNYTSKPEKNIYTYYNRLGKSNILTLDLNSGQKKIVPLKSAYQNLFVNGKVMVLTKDSSFEIYNKDFDKVIEEAKFPFQFDRVFVDSKNNKWLSTSDRGIYFIRTRAPDMLNLNSNWRQGILAIDILDSQTVLIRTEKNGLISLKENGNSKLVFYNTQHPRIRGFARTKNYNLVGTDGGIFRTSHQFSSSINIEKGAVKDIETTSEDEVLIGCAASAFLYRKDSLIYIHNKRTTAICRFNTNTIWLGGLHGIYQNIETNEGFKTSKLKLNDMIDDSRIVDIQKDKHGNIWIATDQRGVFLYSKNNTILHFGQNEKDNFRMLSDICFQIKVADDSSLWFSTLGGPVHIKYFYKDSKPEFSIQNLTISEGIPGKIINYINFWNKKLILVTPDGLFIYQSIPKLAPSVATTLINEIKVNNKIYYGNNIVLPYYENNLLISYTSSFINSGTIYQFRYRIKELNIHWIETNTLQVPILGLESGKYTFEIAAINSQGHLGEIKSLTFTIKSPWYKQWWFILLISLIILLSILYYFKLLKDKVRLGKNLTLLRLRILRAQMNPHFVFNALSNIQRLIHVKELGSANEYIGTLASIMRKSLDYSDKEFISLDKEIEYTQSYLEIEKLRFSDKFDYKIECNIDKTEMEAIYIPPLLLQPLVENSIKHAFKGIKYKGELNIVIEMKGKDKISYNIKDNGCGFDTSTYSAKEFGLGIARERVELLYKNMKQKGYFKIKSKTDSEDRNRGTEITIELPVLRD